MRAAIVVLLAGCATTGPKAVLEDYLTAEAAGRYPEAHALLTREDQRARSLEAFAAEHYQAGPIWLAVARRTTFELGKLEEYSDHLRVDVVATHPDLAAVEAGLAGLPTELLANAEDPDAAMAQYVEDELARRPFPPSQETLVYALRESQGEWRVWLGLARQDAAIALVQQARSLDDPYAARDAWQAVLELPPDPMGAVDAIQDEVRKALADAPPLPPPDDTDAGGAGDDQAPPADADDVQGE